MTAIQDSLSAMRVQLQFELTEAGAAVAQASQLTKRERQTVQLLAMRCDQFATQLDTAMSRESMDPGLLLTMRRLYGAQCRALQAAQTRLRAADEHETLLREQLATMRNRDRSLEKALQAERRRQALEEQRRDLVREDDLWMQRATRP